MQHNLKNIRDNTASYKGFTIVELLIVIVVIGVLASITAVAYTGVTTNANRQSAAAELNAWEKLFLSYKATYGVFPTTGLANGAYCLGTGFINGSCRHNSGAPPYSHPENSAGAASIITEIRKVGVPPLNTRKYTVDSLDGTQQGPYVFVAPTYVELHTFTTGLSNDDCLKYNTVYAWRDASNSGYTILQCKKVLNL
jgi:prepilin-type N-terminal cleavage/methylation domain-containing protein